MAQPQAASQPGPLSRRIPLEVMEIKSAGAARRRPSAKKAGKPESVSKRQASPERGGADDRQQCAFFVRALRFAMVQRSWGVRELSAAIGVEVGTMTKYLRAEVNPYRVGFGIMRHLATELGVTMESLDAYFCTGDFGNGVNAAVTIDQVEAWIRTCAGVGDLPLILEAQTELARRIRDGQVPVAPMEPGDAPAEPEPYLWPLQALEEREVPERMRERLGLSPEVIELLSSKGEYTDEVVEAFSVLFDLTEEVLRKAFDQRTSPELV